MTALAAAEHIYLKRDLRVPTFDVKIRQKDLVASHDVVSVRYTDAIGQIDTFELTVNNWDAETRDFKYTGVGRGGEDGPNTKLFLPGQVIELSMGYRRTDSTLNDEPLRLMLVGIITSIAPTFPTAGQPTVKVTGQSVLRELLTKKAARSWENQTDSDIADDIGKKTQMRIGGKDVKVKTNRKDDEARHKFVVQATEYDLFFLMQRAHRIGYEVVLRYEGDAQDPVLYFGPSPTATAAKHYRLEWGRSLIQFSPTLTTTRQVSKVTVRYWDGAKKELVAVTAETKGLETEGLKEDDVLKEIQKGFLEREDVITDQPFRDKDAAMNFAKARLAEVSRDLVTGKGSTIGTPDLRAGSQIEIAGLGQIFSGNYFVTSTTHTLGSGGYITEFDARREEKKS